MPVVTFQAALGSVDNQHFGGFFALKWHLPR